VVRPRSCRVIYYFDTPALGRRHQSFGRVILIYVDDILVTGFDASAISTLIHHMQSIFHVKDLGSLFYFLGMEADRSLEGLHLR
jgi:hypothetical protein